MASPANRIYPFCCLSRTAAVRYKPQTAAFPEPLIPSRPICGFTTQKTVSLYSNFSIPEFSRADFNVRQIISQCGAFNHADVNATAFNGGFATFNSFRIRGDQRSLPVPDGCNDKKEPGPMSAVTIGNIHTGDQFFTFWFWLPHY